MSPQHSPAGPPRAAPLADLARAADAFLPTGNIVYLNCAAQAPRLEAVHAAGAAALAEGASPWELATSSPAESTEQLRAQVARLFDGDTDALACIPSASYGLATAARNLPLVAGDGVLVLEGQFPSNLLPWQQRCEETGARLIGVQRAPGVDWTEAVLKALQQEDRVRIVALPQVRWDDGALLDLDRIAARVHDIDAALVLDLSQSLGVLATDMARWQPAFAVSVGYKWLLGPLGLGWLWAAPEWRERGQPIEAHWSARDAGADWRFPLAPAPPWRRGARRFDAGGLDDPVRLAMAGAGLDQVLAWGTAGIADALGLRTRALDHALDEAGLGAWKTQGHAPHITALRPPADQLDAVYDVLRQAGIVCTRRYGLLRLSPHLQVDVAAMRRVAGVAALAGSVAAGGCRLRS